MQKPMNYFDMMDTFVTLKQCLWAKPKHKLQALLSHYCSINCTCCTGVLVGVGVVAISIDAICCCLNVHTA